MNKKEIISNYKTSKKPSKKRFKEHIQRLYLNNAINKNQYNSYGKPLLFNNYFKMLKEIYKK